MWLDYCKNLVLFQYKWISWKENKSMLIYSLSYVHHIVNKMPKTVFTQKLMHLSLLCILICKNKCIYLSKPNKKKVFFLCNVYMCTTRVLNSYWWEFTDICGKFQHQRAFKVRFNSFLIQRKQACTYIHLRL